MWLPAEDSRTGLEEGKKEKEQVPLWKVSVWEAYGMRYSMMLLMVCLSTMMTAIWMKRSVMQPLGWHWRAQQDRGCALQEGRVGPGDPLAGAVGES